MTARALTLISMLMALTTLPLSAADIGKGITVIENFDGIFELDGTSRWRGNAEVIEAATETGGPSYGNLGNDTRFVKLSAGEKGKKELVLAKLTVSEDSILSFRYRTELAARFGQIFKVYINDSERTAPDGVDMGWRTERLKLSAGEYAIRFEVENLRGAKIVNGYNAVFIDDVTLFPDKTAQVVIRPRGEQHTWLGAEGTSKLRFTAQALYPDLSPKSDAGTIQFAASGGTIDKSGLWTPIETGSFTVTATLGNFSVISSRLVVHESGDRRAPFTYSGTGKTYAGYTGGERAQNAQVMPSRESLSISNPTVAEFNADAFFLLEGTVKRASGKNYARILVSKVENTTEDGKVSQTEARSTARAKLQTWYIVKDSFSRRIWLPFGPGEYRVEMIEFDSAQVTTPPKGEGMFRGGSYSQQPLVFTVYNTREEDSDDNSGHWLYPSFNIQSDDFRITNLLNDITFGITGKQQKIRAIHDYLVSTLVYDTASFANSGRSRRMDALSVIENGTAVCDGYSNLSAALLRSAGIPCRIMLNKSIMHSWNQVWIDGGWKFYDATWDDPVPDKGQGIVQHTYFLLDSLSGGDGRHRGSGIAVPGDVE